MSRIHVTDPSVIIAAPPRPPRVPQHPISRTPLTYALAALYLLSRPKSLLSAARVMKLGKNTLPNTLGRRKKTKIPQEKLVWTLLQHAQWESIGLPLGILERTRLPDGSWSDVHLKSKKRKKQYDIDSLLPLAVDWVNPEKHVLHHQPRTVTDDGRLRRCAGAGPGWEVLLYISRGDIAAAERRRRELFTGSRTTKCLHFDSEPQWQHRLKFATLMLWWRLGYPMELLDIVNWTTETVQWLGPVKNFDALATKAPRNPFNLWPHIQNYAAASMPTFWA